VAGAEGIPLAADWPPWRPPGELCITHWIGEINEVATAELDYPPVRNM
jgi:hypothetical protein